MARMKQAERVEAPLSCQAKSPLLGGGLLPADRDALLQSLADMGAKLSGLRKAPFFLGGGGGGGWGRGGGGKGATPACFAKVLFARKLGTSGGNVTAHLVGASAVEI